MTNWQIFALSSPAIVAAVMWLQGKAEAHFEFSESNQEKGSALAELFWKSQSEPSTQGIVYSASRSTHLKIVVVAIAAIMIVASFAISSRSGESYGNRVLRAGKSAIETAIGPIPYI